MPDRKTFSAFRNLLPAAMLATTVAFAPVMTSAPTAIAAELELDTKVVTATLDNGLEVLVIPDSRAPVVTHMVWYKAGSADEPPGKSGIAHYLEHLMFKGTKNAPAGEFSAKVAEHGGQENAFTSYDYTAYFQRVTPSILEEVMALEADRMENLVLTDAVIDPERNVVIEERKSRTENRPQGLFGEAMNAALYRNHRYGIPIIGWRHEIDDLDKDDAIEFYNRFYTPNNAVLVVAGDIEPLQVIEMAKRTYGKVERRAEPGERARPSEPPSRAPRRVEMTDPRVTVPSFQRQYLVPSYLSGEEGTGEALDILSEILGGSTTSRIHRALVLDARVAANAGAWYQGNAIDDTTFGFYATPRPGSSVEDVEREVDAVIASLQKDGVTQEEVDRARNRLLKSAIFAQDSQATLARIYGAGVTSGSTVEEIKSWPQRISDVTVEDVNRAARDYLELKRSVTGTLLPEPAPNVAESDTADEG